jgi:glycosyltransferase involved in cell wall biosynthesis
MMVGGKLCTPEADRVAREMVLMPLASPPPLPGPQPSLRAAAAECTLPLLAVVVITRNEARHIGACLRAVLDAVQSIEGTRVLVIDSDSDDDTTAIAASYPAEVYRYRSPIRTAAAGRRVGTDLTQAEFLLFVDGDSRLEFPWLSIALAHMDADPKLALVSGRRRDVFEGEDETSGSDDAGFGGTALYRFAALREVGGFHPYLAGEEEGEILGRLRAAGYRALLTPELMITHYTVRKDSWGGMRRRVTGGMVFGSGQVLRVALRNGLFAYHARRLNRTLIALVYLLVGVLVAGAIALGAPSWLELGWLGLGIAAFVALWWRHGEGIRSALYITTDWLLGAIGIAAGFLRPPPHPDQFQPSIEPVSGVAVSAALSATDEASACRPAR